MSFSRSALNLVVSTVVVLSMGTVFHAQTRKKAAPAAAKATKADTEQLVADGEKVYQSVCVVCHQPSGEGKEKLAANLLTSPYVAGDPGRPIRIILNGKQGKVGLMPGQRNLLSDEQIAAVVTYIRRSWGHKASTVDPSQVKEIRALTAERTTPWTDDDLEGLKGK